MPKPPTAERGRRAAVATAPPPPPSRRGGRTRPPRSTPRNDPERYRSFRPMLSMVLCVLGLGVSIYLTLLHYTTAISLVCPVVKGIDCQKVITSPESLVFGVPVAVLGLVFFVSMTVLCSPLAWRAANRFIAPVRLAASVTGIGFVCYLLYAELYEIHAICLWCTSVHVLTFLLFVTLATGWDDALAMREEASALS